MTMFWLWDRAFGRRIIYTEDGKAGFSETLIHIHQNKVRFKRKLNLQIVFEIIFI